jgi:endonuclease/exonuclease/phosphatase family metal-dependent hydrolase
VVAAALLLLTLAGMVAPQRAGPVAALAVLAPYAYGLLAIGLVPLAVLRRDALLATTVVVATTLAAVAYAPTPAVALDGGDPEVTVLTWNLHGEPADQAGLQSVLDRWRPDVVLLQEAGADAAALLSGQMTVMAHPEAATPPGMVVATRLPVLASGQLSQPSDAWDVPRAFWSELQVGDESWTFLNLHASFPMPLDSLPCPYCPTRRDAQLAAVAAFAAGRIAAGERVVLAGDFNLTDREVAYRELPDAGLRDVARDLTWRPLAVRWLPAMLRLDYVHIGPGLAVVRADTDCAASGSDHCPVVVVLRES